MNINNNPNISDIKINILQRYEDKQQSSHAVKYKQLEDNDSLSKKEIDDKMFYYSAFGHLGGVFENNSQLKENITEHLSNMAIEDKGLFLINSTQFAPRLDGIVEKDKNKEFATMQSTIKYYQTEINNSLEYDSKNGEDTSKIRKMLSNLLKVIQNSQSQEQQSQYITLGQTKNNNE